MTGGAVMPAKAKKKQAKKETKAGAAKKGESAPSKQKPKAKPEGKEAPAADLAALKKTAQEAKAVLDKAGKEAAALRAKAQEVEAAAKRGYAGALAPYRDACRRAGTKCELDGIKAPPVAPRVRFLVERVKGGVKTSIKGRPETEEVVPDEQLKDSVGRAAKAYCERHLGGVDTQGAKFAGLGNRFRAVLAGK